MLKQYHLSLLADDVAFPVAVYEPTTDAAESPFRQEEDVAITLERKHGLLLRLLRNWRGRGHLPLRHGRASRNPPNY